MLLVRTPDGDFYDKRLVLNLAADSERGGSAARTVRRVLDPFTGGTDVPAVVAFESRLAEPGERAVSAWPTGGVHGDPSA